MSAGGGVFAAFRRFLLNKDKSKDGVLQERLETELGVLNEYLERIEDEGCFFGGNSYNAADVALLPRLYRMKVALKSFKEWEIPTSLEKVLTHNPRHLTLLQYRCLSIWKKLVDSLHGERQFVMKRKLRLIGEITFF